MHSPHVFKSASTATATATSTTTTVTVSGVSQPESTVGQRPQGYFMGLSTTAHRPAELTQTSSTYYQQDELRILSDTRLLPDINASQTDPFDTLATYITATSDDDHQGRSTSSLSLSNEPSRSQRSSQPVGDVVPIVIEEPSPNPIHKWILNSGDKTRPFQCGHEGCGRKYSKKEYLQTHFVTHTGDSKLRCYLGDCAGKIVYRDVRVLTQHTQAHHTFERPFGCELCDRRFRCADHLRYHREHVHLIKSKKKSPKPQSVSKSSSATTTTHPASTSTMTSGVSQSKLAAEQRQQGSFVGLSTTVHTPEPTPIPATDYQQDELRPLSDISVPDISSSQTNSFEPLATYITATFDGDHQGRSTSSFSLSNEPSQSQKSSQTVDDVVPIVIEEQSPDSTDKWIIMSGSKKRQFQCGYEGCGRKYSKKAHLLAHFVTHTGDSQLRCYLGDCAGKAIYLDVRELTRHTHVHHTFERLFRCELCDKRFRRADHLRYHKKHVHFFKAKKKSPKPQSVSKSSCAASTSTDTARVSQPELAAGQRQQGSFVGLSTTIHTPEPTLIPATYVSASRTDPFDTLAKYITAIFDDHHQGRSASSLSLSNELSRSQRSSQPVNDVVPIVKEEQSPDPTDRWITMSGDDRRPFKCGHIGCGRKYSKKESLLVHFVTHTGDSKLRCYHRDCAGTVIYPNTRALTRHICAKHTLEKLFECEICHKRFKRKDSWNYHTKNVVHSSQKEKKSPKPQSVSKSSSAATTTITASTSTDAARVSQPESAAGQQQQGSFVDLSKTVHKPEPAHIAASYPHDEPRFLSDDDLRFLSDLSDMDISKISTPHIDPFEILATHQTVTFEDQLQEQEQTDAFLLPFDELLQPGYDFDPMASEDPDDVNLSILPNNNDHSRQASTGIVPKAVLVGSTGGPKPPSKQHKAYKRTANPTDKWIMMSGDDKKPFKCGHKGCGKKYTRKYDLRLHFVKHTGDSPYKCYLGKCDGRIVFSRKRYLTWHIRSKHTLERPYQCEVCSQRFMCSDYLRVHRRKVHSIENEEKSPKRKKK